DLSARGVEVRSFGGRTRMPAGPAMLALRTGAPLFVASLWYDDDYNARGRLEGPLPIPADGPLDVRVRTLTQQIADRLAHAIGAHLGDWHRLQRLWRPEESTKDQTAAAASSAGASPVDVPAVRSSPISASSVTPSSVDASLVTAADPVGQESG